MKIDFSEVLKGFSGETIEENDEPLTLSMACLLALKPDFEKDQDMGGEKLLRWDLVRRINMGGLIEVSAVDIEKIKERVGRLLSTPVVGAAFDILNGKQKEN